MSPLSEIEVRAKLKSLPGWKLENGEIVREAAFKDFIAAMGFVNSVASEAETAGHHPDIDIRYNRVRLALTTHDAGGLTDRDFSLARSIEAIIAASVP